MTAILTAINGGLHPSQAAAGRAHARTRAAVCIAVNEGRDVGGKRGRPPIPIRLYGHVWPSRQALASDLGICVQHVDKLRRTGRLRERVYALVMARSAGGYRVLGVSK